MKRININELQETGVSHNERIRKRTLLKNREVGTIVNYARAVFPPGEKAAAHRHDDLIEIFTVESGQGRITVDEAEFDFSAGVVAVIYAGETHEIINTGHTDLVVSYFSVPAAQNA